jgi:hypothetical protein
MSGERWASSISRPGDLTYQVGIQQRQAHARKVSAEKMMYESGISRVEAERIIDSRKNTILDEKGNIVGYLDEEVTA